MGKITNSFYFFKVLLLFFAGFIVFSCGESAEGPGSPGQITPLSEDEDDDFEDRDRDWTRRQSSSDDNDDDDDNFCEEDDDECEEFCEVFSTNDKRSRCMRLTRSVAEGIFRALHTRLKEPIKYRDLTNIQPEDIKQIMRIGPRYLENNIDDFSSSDAEKVLAWIASDSLITSAFYDNGRGEDEAFRILEELFKKVDNSLAFALRFDLGSGHFIEQAGANNNSRAFRWVHEMFMDECIKTTNLYESVDETYRKSICTLGELYCFDEGESFKDVFSDVINRDQRMHEYIIRDEPEGLEVKRKKAEDIEKVCDELCDKFSSASAC